MKVSLSFLALFLSFSIFFSCSNNNSESSSEKPANSNIPKDVEFGTMMDKRDNQSYPTVKVGEQTWFATNLKIEMDSTWCYDSDDMNCKRFGRLYPYQKALVACPEGWHLPSLEEWEALALHLGSNREAFENEGDKALYDKIIKGGSTHLNLILSGFYNPTINRYSKLDSQGSYWTTEKFGSQAAMCAILTKAEMKEGGSFIFSPGSKEVGHSCRCVKD